MERDAGSEAYEVKRPVAAPAPLVGVCLPPRPPACTCSGGSSRRGLRLGRLGGPAGGGRPVAVGGKWDEPSAARQSGFVSLRDCLGSYLNG